MNSFTHHLVDHLEKSNIGDYHVRIAGTYEGRYRIIADGIRGFVLADGGKALGTHDIKLSLSRLPRQIKEALFWTGHEDSLSCWEYSSTIHNRFIANGRVKGIKLKELIEKFSNREFDDVRFGAMISDMEEVFYRNVVQLRRFFDERLGQPRIIAEYSQFIR